MPGVGFTTTIKILTFVADGSAFRTAGHLAAYAGLAPVTPGVRAPQSRVRPTHGAATTP